MMSLKQKTIKGLFWSFGSQGGRQVIQFIITIILARLLTPYDFGLIGMVTVITGFVTVFGDLGVGKTLIYKQDLTDDHLSSAFWINVVFGVFLTVLLIFLASAIALFYKQPELKAIFMVMSFNFIFASFTIVQQSLLAKKMDFKSLTIREIVAIAFSGVLGIICAMIGFGVWSLVVQALAYTVTNGIMLWLLSPWRPKFKISFSAIRSMFQYSSDVTGFGIFAYLARNIDYLIIGRFLGPQVLGLYTLAYRLMFLPLNNVTFVVTKVMFPAFSQLQQDLPRVRRAYLKMVKYISIVTFPLMCGLFVLAPEFIQFVYGEKWLAVIPLVQVMCICGMAQSIYSTTPSIFLSQGKSRQLLWISIFNCLIVALTIIVGLPGGIYRVAVSYTIGQMIWVIIVQLIANRVIMLKKADFLIPLLKSGIFSAIMLIAIAGIKNIYVGLNSLAVMIAGGITGIIFYFSLLFIFDRDIVMRALNMILGKSHFVRQNNLNKRVNNA